MEASKARSSGARRFFGALGRALVIAFQALANSSGVGSAAGDDPRTQVKARRDRDVPH
jgi:hypothetical protein